MSGRSAYVRKEKTKIKSEKEAIVFSNDGESDKQPSNKALSIDDLPMPQGRQPQYTTDVPFRNQTQPQYQGQYQNQNQYQNWDRERDRDQNNEIVTIRTNVSGGSDDLAYARVRKPQVPVIDVSGIEKSSFRTKMDKQSEKIRGVLTFGGGKKKKKAEEDFKPATDGANRQDIPELDADEFIAPAFPRSHSRAQGFGEESGCVRPAPPTGRLPAISQGPQLRRWMGSGRPSMAWNKLRKDPELWDPNGDTLIYFGHDTHHASRPPPSFRLSSHVIEQTESRHLITLLREGSIDEGNNFSMPPSLINSPSMRNSHMNQGRQRHPTPPTSDGSASGGFDGQISYEIYFPPPMSQSKTDTIRHQVATRNVFALLYQTSLVGLNLYQALTDLYDHLEVYMPDDVDAAGMIIDYLVSKGIDDVRDNPSNAVSLLAWSETSSIRWEEGWKEAYVHCSGMYLRLQNAPEYKYVTPITRALLERASYEVTARITACEERFVEFNFDDMWPEMSTNSSPARAAFERLRKFFLSHYQNMYEVWPPVSPDGDEQWLTRGLAKKLQKDFGSLYDYLVNREVAWDGSVERNGRKWNIVDPRNRGFNADTDDCPFTEIIVAFDNTHRFPHIPHPYPLVPESLTVRNDSRDNQFKTSKKAPTKQDSKMAERRAALAYTESTNIYLLGSDFTNNDLVDSYVRFEKSDQAGDVDPYAARRGRWVLIYGVLQILASVSVDTPNLRYIKDVSYHLNPRLRGTPPWKGANPEFMAGEASHNRSYCWTVRDTWRPEAPVVISRRGGPGMHGSVRSSAPGSVTSSDAGSMNMRSPTLFNDSVSGSVSGRSSSAGGRRGYVTAGGGRKEESNCSGYAPGIEKVEEYWPIREEGREYMDRERAVERERSIDMGPRKEVQRRRMREEGQDYVHRGPRGGNGGVGTKSDFVLPIQTQKAGYNIKDFDEDSFRDMI
ncbi:uncharacterized protein RSE6_04574 [Rhynchosporium secalis]|uniref:DUF8004 domain-containing protein n=1 Tax=Rhynchosporium secalis TaxID=38038 RepID=A0A1E1M5Q5_RHYSE|nr:uncharacterized protein RSE6_04574 [Rhynchosporium secalis]